MKLNEYQVRASATAQYGDGNAINYPILGLVGEAGELANKYKKVLRDDGGILHPDKRKAMADELGDVLWYVAALARDLGEDLESIATKNLEKLYDRKARGVISGSGDER